MTIECDVLVVGAGPAGSSAAWAAAKGGAKTIFIDKKKEVGVPVQCAEGIGSYLISHLPFKMPKDQLLWKIDGISFNVDDITIERKGGMWSGYAINREKFDKWLADNAVKAGAKLLLDTELIDVETREGYHVSTVRVKTNNVETEIKPKVVIAADGVDSTVLNLLGFEVDLEKTGYVYSFELSGVKVNSNLDYMFFGDFAPGGYGYIFPLSNNRANVGVAALFKKDSIKEFYDNFLELPEVNNLLGGENLIIKEKEGLVPFLPQTEKWHYGNILFVGDAANQNLKPFVEGFLPGILCGDIAGQSAAEYAVHGKGLESYVKTIEEKCKNFFEYSDVLTKILYETGKKTEKTYHLIRVGIVSDLFSLEELNHLKTLDYSILKKIILKRYKKQ
ncbi:ribulose-1,5-biphosphate synthetase [archaeon BMS3Abin16]|nr:ribulose-1,5-biphosphate synthetase [archaeon BMS3Abin16]